MHVIKSIDQLGHEEIVELARAAADNGQPLHEANPFAPGTSQHCTFNHWYWARHRELVEA
jgi:hypothetical protein